MKTTTVTTFSTLQQIWDAKGNHQVTAQELLNGRSHINGQWQDIELTQELREQICGELSELYGGRTATKQNIYRHLRNERRQHWGLKQTHLENYTGLRFGYCAGQDMPSELRDIRKYLSN